ncbi:hypothetical protein [Carboxylicivirga marina]|uniref:Uncharacterized protein n=1 Tax=Carboxylicivirga marina TaxID=2800988 RepID=A0ABS1HJC4_9BACT|nr:hypothetical protein [Carboxylicivirga marina]MBK3517778.1 hypothetical protein [Carboxylicivirga marina]
MKTLNNLTSTKSFTSVLFILLVLSLSISAQPMMNEFPESEMEITVENWMTDLNSFDIDEPSMEIEAWMTDLSSFTEPAEEMLVEDWMSDLESFNVPENEVLEVEMWMTSLDEYYTTLNDYLFADAEEVELELEDWMTNLSAFSKVDANEIEGIKTIDIESACPVLIALKN